MKYFGQGFGNDVPFWEADYIIQLENTVSFVDTCAQSSAVSETSDATVEPSVDIPEATPAALI